MAKFSAATAVEDLEYDFTKYVPGCSGVIPEPSADQIETYFEKAREIAKTVMHFKNKVEDTENLTEEEVQELVTDLEGIDVHGMQEQMIVLISDVCSNQPSAEDITALPFRVRQEFVKWVGAQFRSQ